jgi:uncharacterized hydrophobic protein (TIGR00271 family)
MTENSDKKAKPEKDSGEDNLPEMISKSASMFRSLFKEGQTLSRARKASVIQDLVESSSPNADYLILVVLSCTIATFGLITNSPAVIIGAMLVAPLMSPILGLSMASITGRSDLFKRSVLAILEGFGSAVALSAILAFLTYRLPFGSLARVSSEVAARTTPSLLDLGIALAGGAAAAYALAHPRLSAALPGVAIATALMPPLCTIGIGIALLNTTIIFGALLLFITNLAAISFSGIVTFALMGFSPRKIRGNEDLSRSVWISALLVMVISVPLAFFAWSSLYETRLYSRASAAVLESIPPGISASLQEISIKTDGQVKNIEVVLRTSRELSHTQVVAMQSDIADRLQRPVALELVTIPMQMLNPLNPPTPTATATPTPLRSPTPTITPTPTLQPTATLQPSPTSVAAFVAVSRGVNVYDAPDGEVLFRLPQNTAVWVDGSAFERVDSVVWVPVRDIFNRAGWVVISQLDIDAGSLPEGD